MSASVHPVPVAYERQLSGDEIARGYHREFVGGHWEELGQLQLDFLIRRGLQPGDRVLDVGCGCLRGGLPLIRFLQPGHYAGVDGNASLLEAASLELKQAGLEWKQPRLLCDGDFQVERFETRFTFALAHSLFTHLPTKLIGRCLQQVARVLAPGGRFYATHFPVPDDHAGGPFARGVDGLVTRDDGDPFHQSVKQYVQLIAGLPLKLTNIGPWGHRRGQHMLEFRLESNLDPGFSRQDRAHRHQPDG